MAKAYLIGGTPRVGKTTLAMRFIKEHPVLAASTDALRYTLRRIVSEQSEPDLFHLGKFTSNEPARREYIKSNPMDVVVTQNKESEIVWRSVTNFIQSNLEDGFDVLVEGIAVMPHLVKELQCDYKVVFLGNQSPEHYQTILSAARSNPADWMHTLEDETIEAFSVFNQTFSRFVEQEAVRHDLPYIEVRDNSFSSDIDAALNVMLAG